MSGLEIAPPAAPPGFSSPAAGATLYGYAATFGTPTTINSRAEGHFVESIAPGAFSRSLAERAGRIPALLDHGQDPQLGNRPLGRVVRLEEDSRGLAFEVQMYDTDYNRALLPGIKDGYFGASFRFGPVKDKVTPRPGKSAANPAGRMEVVRQEVDLREVSVTVFPAYGGTRVAVRFAMAPPPLQPPLQPPGVRRELEERARFVRSFTPTRKGPSWRL